MTSSGWPTPEKRRPGPSAPRPSGRRPFGSSWWGAAWVEALEQRARLDPNRLPRGRTYARSGAVGTLSIAPGEILADVQGSRRTPYSVRVRVRIFSAEEWGRVLDALAAEIGHTAALLDGELPPFVADDIRGVGLDLLPGPGELQPRCSCPDWADPCKHSAAVCYLVADLLDADPFGVLLLRGLTRDEILSALRSRRHLGVTAPLSVATVDHAPDHGVLARDAFAGQPRPLPPLPPLPERAGHPSVLATDPPFGVAIEVEALRALAEDAAERALSLARGGGSDGLDLSRDEDLARRAAKLLAHEAAPSAPPTGPSSLTELARRAGIPPRELLRRGLAYREWGREGLRVLDDTWSPAPHELNAGRALAGVGGVARHNRITAGARQLRLGRSGRWYPFEKDRSGRWLPAGPALFAPGEDDAADLGALDDH